MSGGFKGRGWGGVCYGHVAGPWGLCLAPQRLPGLPWGGAHTCHPWAVAACHQRGPQACSNVTTSWESPRPGSLLWLPLPFRVWRRLPLSDLGFLVKCNFLSETFQTPKAGQPHSVPPGPLFILRVPQHPGILRPHTSIIHSECLFSLRAHVLYESHGALPCLAQCRACVRCSVNIP